MRFSSSRSATSRTLVPIATETIAVVMRSPAVSRLGVTAGSSALALDNSCVMRSSPPRQECAVSSASRARSGRGQRFHCLHRVADVRIGWRPAWRNQPGDRHAARTSGSGTPFARERSRSLPPKADRMQEPPSTCGFLSAPGWRLQRQWLVAAAQLEFAHQRTKIALLRIGEAVIERLGRICDQLELLAHFLKMLGHHRHAFDRRGAFALSSYGLALDAIDPRAPFRRRGSPIRKPASSWLAHR